MVSDSSTIQPKGTPDGDLPSKSCAPREAITDHPSPMTHNLSPITRSHPGTSSLRARRLWNTTTINKKAPRMKFSQKELSWNVP
jgi:hypothetical protein